MAHHWPARHSPRASRKEANESERRTPQRAGVRVVERPQTDADTRQVLERGPAAAAYYYLSAPPSEEGAGPLRHCLLVFQREECAVRPASSTVKGGNGMKDGGGEEEDGGYGLGGVGVCTERNRDRGVSQNG